jgi:C-terminal processing protease CtpA/Prc
VELVLNAKDGIVSISYVCPDRGACEAGVQKDSRLLKVGNTSVSSVTRDATPAEALDRVVKLLMGEKGSHVEVQVEYYSKKAKRYLPKTVTIVNNINRSARETLHFVQQTWKHCCMHSPETGVTNYCGGA